MEFEDYGYEEEYENESHDHLPFHNLKPGSDPIPFLFWNMMTMAKKFRELNENMAQFRKKQEQDGIPICPNIIRQALARRGSELPPIPESAGEKVPWDEFFIWLSNQEKID